jgi:hypothetical protein
MKVSYNLKATYRDVRSCFYTLSQIVSQMLIVHDRFFWLNFAIVADIFGIAIAAFLGIGFGILA